MATEQKSFLLGGTQPGVSRDGTTLASDGWQDAQWVRFQRGKPRKMGGYRAISQNVIGPVRQIHVDTRTGNAAHTFSPHGIEKVMFDSNGIGGSLVDRTPSGMTYNANRQWSTAVVYSQTGGSFMGLFAADTQDLQDISSDVAGGIFYGDITLADSFAALTASGTPLSYSGGCMSLQPVLALYGSNGEVRTSQPNDVSDSTGWILTGDVVTSGIFNVTDTKIVKGLAMRGGSNAPSGLLWSLGSLIRMSFVGGTALWQFDTLSENITVLSKNAIIEYDGIFIWPGIDRFFMYGGTVQEVPNPFNADYFFENLNYDQRQKIFAMKIPRFGEIWWFYPSGSSTTCDSAVIFNVKEQCWYDAKLQRTAGFSAKVFRFPMLAGGAPVSTVKAPYTVVAGIFQVGMKVSGGTSHATGSVARITPGQINITVSSGTFVNGETVQSLGVSPAVKVSLTAIPIAQTLETLWEHESGADKIVGQQVTAIQAYCETGPFQWMTGGPVGGQPGGDNLQTRLVSLEPDFKMKGSMTMQVRGKSYAQDVPTVVNGGVFVFDGTTPFINPHVMKRELSVRFESNEVGGDFQMGRVLTTIEPGDPRG